MKGTIPWSEVFSKILKATTLAIQEGEICFLHKTSNKLKNGHETVNILRTDFTPKMGGYKTILCAASIYN